MLWNGIQWQSAVFSSEVTIMSFLLCGGSNFATKEFSTIIDFNLSFVTIHNCPWFEVRETIQNIYNQPEDSRWVITFS